MKILNSDLISQLPDLTGKNVLIIGHPATGKTTLAKELILKYDHDLICTDKYMSAGYDGILDELLRYITKKPTIVEGVQGYRLLRRGARDGSYHPDIVIELVMSEEDLEQRYRVKRSDKEFKYVKIMMKACEKVLEDYRQIKNKKATEWYKITKSSKGV